MISCSILNQNLEKFNLTTIIHVAVNELLHNITGTEVKLQNILKIAARCKMHGISKIFVSSVLNTCKVLSDMVAKFNLDIKYL